MQTAIFINHSDGLRPSDSPTRSLAGARKPHSARVDSLARSFAAVVRGLKLTRMAGDVEGHTTNGGIDVDLDGAGWQGGGLDLQTTNGGVHLTVPAQYNAHLEAGTTNGGVRIDFPVTVQGTIGKSFSTDLGSGGAPIKVRTSNGGVKITKK